MIGGFAVTMAQVAALLVAGVAVIVYGFTAVVRHLRYPPPWPGEANALTWHLFVPARNEERVIGETVDYLRAAFPAAHVWVVDDHSADRTAPIVADRAAVDPLTHLVCRREPDARTGRGDVLNAAYRALNRWLPICAYRGRIIVGVIEPGRQPVPGCLDACAGPGLFGEAAVGSVRITRLGARAVPPGQGQFTRLSALDVVTDGNGRPWRGKGRPGPRTRAPRRQLIAPPGREAAGPVPAPDRQCLIT
jgi:1,2-diacylglycerol 3-beta-glucosyltransferase